MKNPINLISRWVLVFSFFSGLALQGFSQQPFSVSLVMSPITAIPPVHSCAFAEWNGKWIFIGGRLDGLHNFQAGMGFDQYWNNDSVFVVDPAVNARWSAPLNTLTNYEMEAISSSNAEFNQADSMLYMTGGYGRCDSLLTNITFPTLTAINLNTLLNAVMSNDSVNSSIRQIQDTNLAVAGGHLVRFDTTYFLVFGHRFNGLYNKISTSTMFVQHYTNAIRKFNINDDGVNLSIANFSEWTDTNQFHRRDLNLAMQIYTNGDFGYTAFGGVFQKNANLPFLSPVDITAGGTQVQTAFDQNLNQYETALMPVYDSINNFMHTIFFGGMSLYTLDTVNNILLQDTLVPFVNTVSKISRDGTGNLTEYKLPANMPSLTGTNSRFIPDRSNPLFHDGIVDLNSLSGNTRAGWIVSGIQSDFPNIADLDPYSMSRPNTEVYEVWIDVTIDETREYVLSGDITGLTVYPNPTRNFAYIDFTLAKMGDTEVKVFDATGKLMKKHEFKNARGRIHISVSTGSFPSGLYTCVIKSGSCIKATKLLVRK